LLSPGNRTNGQGLTPVEDRVDVRAFQLNVDGQQVTSNLGTGNQARTATIRSRNSSSSRNRFDATQGRIVGRAGECDHQVGTNRFFGIVHRQLSGQQVQLGRILCCHRVLPYSNQQTSGSYGGPIVLNRTHFFANYEYEHQPLTSIWNTPYPSFNVQLTGLHTVKLAACGWTSSFRRRCT